MKSGNPKRQKMGLEKRQSSNRGNINFVSAIIAIDMLDVKLLLWAPIIIFWSLATSQRLRKYCLQDGDGEFGNRQCRNFLVMVKKIGASSSSDTNFKANRCNSRGGFST